MNSYVICRLLQDYGLLNIEINEHEEFYQRLRGRALLYKARQYNLPNTIDENFYFRQWDLIQQRTKKKNHLACLFTLTWLLLDKFKEYAQDLAVWFMDCMDSINDRDMMKTLIDELY